MSQWIRAVVVSLAVAFAAGGAFAQVDKTETATEAETGEIVALDAEAKTITVKGADEDAKVYVADPKVNVMSSKKGATGDQAKETIDFTALKVGQQVVLNADLRDGKNVVTYIEVVDDPGAGD